MSIGSDLFHSSQQAIAKGRANESNNRKHMQINHDQKSRISIQYADIYPLTSILQWHLLAKFPMAI